MNPEKVFKKYDIRAVIGKDLLLEEIYPITKAIIKYFLSKEPTLKEIVIGMDVRIHSQTIKKNIINAILDSHLNVIDLDTIPTPLLYFYTKTLNKNAGIMITASHNPKEYNGLKIVLNNKPVWDKELQKIKDIYFNDTLMVPSTFTLNQMILRDEIKLRRTQSIQFFNIIPKYMDFLAQEFEHLKNINLNCVIDCANGTAGYVLKDLIKKMNWQSVELIFQEGDGYFPNHEPDPSHEENLPQLKEKLINGNYSFGMAFDGDCDRFAVMQKNGKLVPSDQLLFLFATKMPKDSTVVCDIKCSSSLINELEKIKLNGIFAQTGCAHIKEEMEKTSALLGGELSGHFCFKDRYFGFDDGIYAMMRFIEISQEKDIDQILSQYPKMVSDGEIRIKCAEVAPAKVVENTKVILQNKNFKITTIDGIRIDAAKSWGILRASNTEPVLSLRFEGQSEKELKEIKLLFYESICKYFDSKELKEKLLN